jgi:hypothetical protein
LARREDQFDFLQIELRCQVDIGGDSKDGLYSGIQGEGGSHGKDAEDFSQDRYQEHWAGMLLTH